MDHCCVEEKCDGTIYHNYSLPCKYCQNPIFVQCLRNQYEKPVKDILMLFGLGEYNGKKFVVNSDDPDKVAVFNSIFNIDSPFAISCYTCDGKIANLLNLGNGGSSKEAEVHKFDIYVSKFPTHTTSTHIKQLVSNFHCDIEENSYEVEDMARSKNIKFKSFKISASNQLTYNILLTSKVWEPIYTAIPFENQILNKPKTNVREPVKRKNVNNKHVVSGDNGQSVNRNNHAQLNRRNLRNLQNRSKCFIKPTWNPLNK